MENFDLIIIGTGSANSILTPDFDDYKVAIIERDVFGGTCLNRGCIPSKMFIYPATLASSATHAKRVGVDLEFKGYDWPAVQSRIFDRIDAIAQGGKEYRESLDNVTVYSESAFFVGPKQVQVGSEVITADTIVIGVGARPYIPDFVGLDTVEYHTSASIMRIAQRPERLAILGGGFIACEMAHIFAGAGSEVTIINRSDQLLRKEDKDISQRLTETFQQRLNVELSTTPTSISQKSSGEITIELDNGSTVKADVLLVATGRTPNGDQLELETTGLSLDDNGLIPVDVYGRTAVEGIWALGDVSNAMQLKHTANAETRAVAHNIINPDEMVTVDYSGGPSAVFTEPQIASFGATEQELIANGTEYITYTQPYSATAYGWAMDDSVGFAKVIADPKTRLLLGAHIIGDEASNLIQTLILGYRFNLTVDQISRGPLYIHPALSEVVEQALLGLPDSPR